MKSVLSRHLEILDWEKTRHILSRDDFVSCLSKQKTRNGDFLFKLKTDGRAVARSPSFSSEEKRDACFLAFIDEVEINFHENYQRKLEF